MTDMVNHPPHYGTGRFECECIDITRLMTFTAGNAFKYIWRHAEKGGAEDLRKAMVYLGWAIEDGEPATCGDNAFADARALFDQHVSTHVSGVYEALEYIIDNEYLYAISAIQYELTQQAII